MPVHPPLVRVVDDFIDGLELVIDMLTAHGFRTASAEDGPDAMQQARRLRPDLIVMDAALPGIDGWEVTRRLKQAARLSSHFKHEIARSDSYVAGKLRPLHDYALMCFARIQTEIEFRTKYTPTGN